MDRNAGVIAIGRVSKEGPSPSITLTVRRTDAEMAPREAFGGCGARGPDVRSRLTAVRADMVPEFPAAVVSSANASSEEAEGMERGRELLRKR